MNLGLFDRLFIYMTTFYQLCGLYSVEYLLRMVDKSKKCLEIADIRNRYLSNTKHEYTLKFAEIFSLQNLNRRQMN